MAMPHPQSPHRPSSADVDVKSRFSLSPDSRASRASFCTPGPLPLSKSPTLSRLPSTTMSTMATAFSDPAPSKDHQQQLPQTFMSLGDGHSTSVPWATHFDLGAASMGQDGIGYALPPQYSPLSPGQSASQVLMGYAPNGLPHSTNYSLSYPQFGGEQSLPRSYIHGGNMGNIPVSESYPPSAYVINKPPKSHDGMELTDQMTSQQLLQMNGECEQQYAPAFKVEESPYGDSSYGSSVGSRCSTPITHGLPMQQQDTKPDCSEDSPLDKEQPYAQLIYRALMDAPGHTMILRDIYNWFKDHTDKAADKETKGWQNSIRHNLSMNGAFEKVDQPNEDARKGFMWRLTDEAIREGVKSTTRYRSKQPNKRGHRSGHPLPQRQASGAKGGHASRRSAKMRRTQRGREVYAHRSDPYNMQVCRSVPIGYDQPIMDSGVDMSMSYPPSPYSGSDVDFGRPSSGDDFGSPMMSSGLDIGQYCPSPFAQDGLYGSTFLMSQDHAEPLFYTDDSPSPSVSEPRTPDMQGDCYMNMGPMDPAYLLEDLPNTHST